MTGKDTLKKIMRQITTVDLFGHNIQGQPKEKLNWEVGVVELSVVVNSTQKIYLHIDL